MLTIEQRIKDLTDAIIEHDTERTCPYCNKHDWGAELHAPECLVAKAIGLQKDLTLIPKPIDFTRLMEHLERIIGQPLPDEAHSLVSALVGSYIRRTILVTSNPPVLNSYLTAPAKVTAGQVYGWKVSAKVGYGGDWAAYRAPWNVPDDLALDQGEKLLEATAKDLFWSIAAAEFQYR